MQNRLEVIQRRLAAYHDQEIDRTIHPDDDMFDDGMESYLRVGLSAIHVISYAMTLSGRTRFEAVLDLPCGFGRVLRHLLRFFPESRVTACDLDRRAVDFCKETFNVEAVYSKENFKEIEFDSKFDLIWCGSLLTHLDEKKFGEALRFLVSCLSDSGIAILTTHGRFALTIQERYHKLLSDEHFKVVERGFNEEGFGYHHYEGFDLPNEESYGVSLSSPSYVLGIVEKIPEIQILCFKEREWSGVHDILMLSKKPISAGF